MPAPVPNTSHRWVPQAGFNFNDNLASFEADPRSVSWRGTDGDSGIGMIVFWWFLQKTAPCFLVNTTAEIKPFFQHLQDSPPPPKGHLLVQGCWSGKWGYDMRYVSPELFIERVFDRYLFLHVAVIGLALSHELSSCLLFFDPCWPMVWHVTCIGNDFIHR